MKFPSLLVVAALNALLLGVALSACSAPGGSNWSAQERGVLESLSLSSPPAPPPDPSNAVGDDGEAANLGHALFFDPRLSRNGQVSCATCHDPAKGFTDGLPLAKGIGTMNRQTLTVVGAAHSPWQFWDGRKDSLWAQALGPLEQPVEHGFTRGEVADVIARAYAEPYEEVFGALPELKSPAHAGPLGDAGAQAAWQAIPAGEREAVTRVFVNVGKAIAAYERQLAPEPSRFDAYVDALRGGNPAGEALLTPVEIAGLRLFIGSAGCTACHSGPRLTDDSFHNTGVPAVAGLPLDRGRQRGAVLVAEDEFNCLSSYSDAAPSQCRVLTGLETPPGAALERAYKVPSLRNVAAQPPYMHAGQFGSLREVLRHYNHAPAAPGGQSELEPLGFSETQLGQLEAFLGTLTSEAGAPR